MKIKQAKKPSTNDQLRQVRDALNAELALLPSDAIKGFVHSKTGLLPVAHFKKNV